MAIITIELSKESYDFIQKHLKNGHLVTEYARWANGLSGNNEYDSIFVELFRTAHNIGAGGYVIQKLIEGKIILEMKRPDLYTVILPVESSNGYKYVFINSVGKIDWTNELHRITLFHEEKLDIIPNWTKPFISKANPIK